MSKLSKREQRRRLIINGRQCLSDLRIYRNPISRGIAAGYYVLIKEELAKMRAQRKIK